MIFFFPLKKCDSEGNEVKIHLGTPLFSESGGELEITPMR